MKELGAASSSMRIPRYSNNPVCPSTKLILDLAAGTPARPGENSWVVRSLIAVSPPVAGLVLCDATTPKTQSEERVRGSTGLNPFRDLSGMAENPPRIVLVDQVMHLPIPTIGVQPLPGLLGWAHKRRSLCRRRSPDADGSHCQTEKAAGRVCQSGNQTAQGGRQPKAISRKKMTRAASSGTGLHAPRC